MLDFWNFEVGQFIYGVFVYVSSYSGCDGDEGIGVPCIVLYGVD